MKTLFLISIFILATSCSQTSQTKSNETSGLDGNYLPIVKVIPIYPKVALKNKIEGECTIEYTVTASGTTKNLKAVSCSNPVFISESIKAASKFKYKPRVVNGKRVETKGVQNTFTFEFMQ